MHANAHTYARTHARMHTDALNMVNGVKLHQRDQATVITEKEDESINDADLIENRDGSSKTNKKRLPGVLCSVSTGSCCLSYQLVYNLLTYDAVSSFMCFLFWFELLNPCFISWFAIISLCFFFSICFLLVFLSLLHSTISPSLPRWWGWWGSLWRLCNQ